MTTRRLLTTCLAAATSTLALAVPSASAAGVCSASNPQYCPTPIVHTGPATHIHSTYATLTGTVNPNGSATKCAFQYGTTTRYGSVSSGQDFPASTSTFSVSILVRGLRANTTYHYRLVCLNAGNGAAGSDLTFKTAKAATPRPPRSRVSLHHPRSAKVDRRRHVSFTVYCLGTTRCVGRATLAIHGGFSSSARYNIRGRSHARVRLTLSPAAFRSLTRHRKLVARITVKDNDHARDSARITLHR